MTRVSLTLAAAAVLVLAACEARSPEETVDPLAARADTVRAAAEVFDSTVFDTITWESPAAAVERGSVVFNISCAKCHGTTGRGDGHFVVNGDTLRPPSFLQKDWRFADDPIGLRRQIFTGNVAGMPYWGLVGLKYRDIDAVARFITEFLRTNYALEAPPGA